MPTVKNMYACPDPDIINFINNFTIEKRLLISKTLIDKSSNVIPIIVGRGEIETTPPINRNKFLSNKDTLFGSFALELRKYMPTLNSNASIFYFINGSIIPCHNSPMIEIYDKYKSPDNFLYILYTIENTFG